MPYYLLIPHCWKGEKKKKGTKQHQSRRGTKQDAKSTGACPPRAQHTHNFPAIVCILDHSLLFFLWWLPGMNGRIATCGCAGEGVFARSATLRIFFIFFIFFRIWVFFFSFSFFQAAEIVPDAALETAPRPSHRLVPLPCGVPEKSPEGIKTILCSRGYLGCPNWWYPASSRASSTRVCSAADVFCKEFCYLPCSPAQKLSNAHLLGIFGRFVTLFPTAFLIGLRMQDTFGVFPGISAHI